MSHLAAFLLRLLANSIMDRYRFPAVPCRNVRDSVSTLLDAADAYDRPETPIDAPAWLRWNCPGGEA